MRLLIASDLHFEFHRDGGKAFIASMPLESVDVVILAGDIGTLRNGLIPALGLICARAKHLVLVLGNHEYYGSFPRDVHRALAVLEQLTPNFHWLHHAAITIDRQRFIGTTLWFPDDPLSVGRRGMLSDFSVIKEFVPWVFNENKRAQDFLNQEVRPTDVVITHHLPSQHCVHPRYRGSPLNAFFVCPMDPLIERAQPKLWIHGHSHESLDMHLGKTRVIRNPFGYAGHEENSGYQEALIVEI